MLCCHGAIRDAETNNISVFNIMEEISAAGVPFFIQKLHIVAFLQRESGDTPNATVTLEITIGDQILHSQPVDLAFGDKLRTRLLAELNGFVISQPGDMMFALKLDGAVLNSWQVKVETRGKPQLELKEV